MYFTGPARQYRSPAALFGVQLPVVAFTVLVTAWEVSGEECVCVCGPPPTRNGPVNAQLQLLLRHLTNLHFSLFSLNRVLPLGPPGGRCDSGGGGAARTVLLVKVSGSISTP